MILGHPVDSSMFCYASQQCGTRADDEDDPSKNKRPLTRLMKVFSKMKQLNDTRHAMYVEANCRVQLAWRVIDEGRHRELQYTCSRRQLTRK